MHTLSISHHIYLIHFGLKSDRTYEENATLSLLYFVFLQTWQQQTIKQKVQSNFGFET